MSHIVAKLITRSISRHVAATKPLIHTSKPYTGRTDIRLTNVHSNTDKHFNMLAKQMPKNIMKITSGSSYSVAVNPQNGTYIFIECYIYIINVRQEELFDTSVKSSAGSTIVSCFRY